MPFFWKEKNFFLFFKLSFFVLLFANYNQANALGSSSGGNFSANSASYTSGSSSSSSVGSSGVTLVGVDGNSYECKPFVDKRWDKTTHSENWNGIYFSLSAENSKFSGKFKLQEASYSNSSNVNGNVLPRIASTNTEYSFSGSSTYPVIGVGGGMLIDRVYLGSDLEVRAGEYQFSKQINIKETVTTCVSGSCTDSEQEKQAKMTYTTKVMIMFNAKIGYLLTDRIMLFANSGIGMFSDSSVAISGYTAKDRGGGNSPAPIKLSAGVEYSIAPHWRLIADYSSWNMPTAIGTFDLSSGSNQYSSYSTNTYSAKLKMRSARLGILYRF